MQIFCACTFVDRFFRQLRRHCCRHRLSSIVHPIWIILVCYFIVLGCLLFGVLIEFEIGLLARARCHVVDGLLLLLDRLGFLVAFQQTLPQLCVFGNGPSDFEYLVLVKIDLLVGVFLEDGHNCLQCLRVIDRRHLVELVVVILLLIEIKDCMQVVLWQVNAKLLALNVKLVDSDNLAVCQIDLHQVVS